MHSKYSELIQSEETRFDISNVLANDLKFKQKLAIGEDAYKSLKIKKSLFDAWDVAGVAVSASGIAKSTAVASTFFGTFWTSIGIGTAVTPVGWVIAAGALGGAAWIGVNRFIKGTDKEKVIIIPNYINTPLDLLATSMFDMLAFVSLKVAEIDGNIDSREKKFIVEHLISEWGFDRDFVEQSLPFIEAQLPEKSLTEQVHLLADFKDKNPDCNYQEMTKELLTFLNELIQADGIIDEREEMAIERVARIFEEKQSLNAKFNKAFLGFKSILDNGLIPSKK